MDNFKTYPTISVAEKGTVMTMTLLDQEVDQKDFSEAIGYLIESGILERVFKCVMRHLDEFEDEDVILLKAMDHD